MSWGQGCSPILLSIPFFLRITFYSGLFHPCSTCSWQPYTNSVRIANSWAGIKPTTPLSAFDKENSIEFSLDLLYYIYNYYCGYAPCLPQSSCPSGDPFVTSCDLWHDHFCDSVTSHVIFPMLHLSNKRKEKKKKRNINNDLAILPSHDKFCVIRFVLKLVCYAPFL